MPALTKEKLEQRVYENSLETCHYVSGYVNRYSEIVLWCEKHNHTFTTRYENVGRATRKHHVCPLCQEEDKNKTKIQVTCDYCGKVFFKTPSDLTQFNFCCRECKDKAQRINSGEKFDAMRPDHYQQGRYIHYRSVAFEAYPHECAACGWDEDEDILEVHHIDENRDNNNLTNLIILCPTCHRKLSSHKYQLNGNVITKKDKE